MNEQMSDIPSADSSGGHTAAAPAPIPTSASRATERKKLISDLYQELEVLGDAYIVARAALDEAKDDLDHAKLRLNSQNLELSYLLIERDLEIDPTLAVAVYGPIVQCFETNAPAYTHRGRISCSFERIITAGEERLHYHAERQLWPSKNGVFIGNVRLPSHLVIIKHSNQIYDGPVHYAEKRGTQYRITHKNMAIICSEKTWHIIVAYVHRTMKAERRRARIRSAAAAAAGTHDAQNHLSTTTPTTTTTANA
jgi:hypothetical protein